MTDPGRPVAPREDELRALIANWRQDADCIAGDGDFCCAQTRRHDADDVEVILAAAPVPCAASPADPWQPIETAPRKEPALFWIIAKRDDECPDVIPETLSIFNGGPPRLQIGTYGSWSSLSKATHWMPLPTPPRATGAGARECSNDLSAGGSDTGPSGTTTVQDTAPAAANQEADQQPPRLTGTASIDAPVAVARDPHRLLREEIERAAWCGNSVYHDDWPQGRYDDRCGACRRSKNAIESLLARLRGEAAVRQEK